MKLIDYRPVGDSEILLTWDDGHRSLCRCDYLRLLCPCAQCVDELSGRRTIRPESIRKDLRAAEVEPVGHYAVRFRWTDGHSTGIYSLDYLRKICPCGQCASLK